MPHKRLPTLLISHRFRTQPFGFVFFPATSPPSPASSVMSELMVALVQASEKAANIARSCRQEDTLFSLLIEEKKSRRLSADFKTLADVLVQEVIKHDIGKQVKL